MVRSSRIVWKGGAEIMQTMCTVAFLATFTSNAAPGSPWEDHTLLT